MANGFYGGAPNAFQGGVEFSAAQRGRQRRENALNAMIERFGPEAGDVGSLAALEGIEQQRQLFPHQLGTAQRHTEGMQAAAQQYGPTAGDPTAYGISAAEEAQQRELQQRAGLNAAVFLQSTKDRGGDLSAAFERVQPVLTSLGLPTEQLGAWRDHIINNPDAVDELTAMLQGADGSSERAMSGGVPMYDEQGALRWVIPTQGGHRVIEGFTPAAALHSEGRLAQGAERLGLGWSQLSWDQAKQFLPNPQPGVQYWATPEGRVVADVTPGSPQERESDAEERERAAALRARLSVARGMREQAATVVLHGNRALERMRGKAAWDRQDPLTAAVRTGATRIPGTDAYEIERDIQSVKDNIGIAELLRIKESGSGLGHVPQSQLETLQSVLGRLEISRDPATLRQDLTNALRIFEQIVQHNDEEVEEVTRQRGLPAPGSYGPQPRPQPGTAQSSPAQPSVDDLLNLYAP